MGGQAESHAESLTTGLCTNAISIWYWFVQCSPLPGPIWEVFWGRVCWRKDSICAPLSSSFIFLRVTWLQASGLRLSQNHLQMLQTYLAPPILQKGMFLLFLDPKPRRSIIAGIDSHGLRKSPTSTQPHHIPNLNPQCHASPSPHSSTHQEPTHSDVHQITSCSLFMSGWEWGCQHCSADHGFVSYNHYQAPATAWYENNRDSEGGPGTFLGLSSGIRWDMMQKTILERTRGVQEIVQRCSITGKGEIWGLSFRGRSSES